MTSTQTRHDDIVIQRRFGVHGSTHAVKQVYAVTYPGHTDHGTEHQSYDDAERSRWPKERGSRCGTRRILRAGGERSLRVSGTPARPLTGLPTSDFSVKK
jgi:hypothetical protein